VTKKYTDAHNGHGDKIEISQPYGLVRKRTTYYRTEKSRPRVSIKRTGRKGREDVSQKKTGRNVQKTPEAETRNRRVVDLRLSLLGRKHEPNFWKRSQKGERIKDRIANIKERKKKGGRGKSG